MRAQIQIVYFNLKATVSNMKVLDAQNFINNSKSDRIYHSALLDLLLKGQENNSDKLQIIGEERYYCS